MADLYSPIGVPGLKQYGGRIDDEWLRQLRGPKGREAIRHMIDSDIVGGILFAIEKLMAQMEWRVDPYVEPGKDAAEKSDEEVAQFVEECLFDMSSDWQMTLSEILTFLPYGFAPMETVYKRRLGPEVKDGPSRYNDGKIGWRKWALRSQDTVDRWELDETGGIQGLHQTNPMGGTVPPMIPIERLLLFRTTAAKNNPEGRSVLRSAYPAWIKKENIETIEGIGIERDLAGLPVIYAPADYFAATASAEAQTMISHLQKIATSIRVDEQGGIVFPSSFDDKGNQLYRIELLSTGGARSFDTNAIIARYSTAIAMTVLADFILLGHQNVGSFALADSKTGVFGFALNSFADLVVGVINQHAIPRLLRLNGMDASRAPELKHGDVEDADLEMMASVIDKLAGKGLITPDASTEAHLREMLGLPPQDEDDIEEVPEEEPVPPQQVVVVQPEDEDDDDMEDS